MDLTTDEQLRIEVIAELDNVPSLAGRRIEVEVRMGMVNMTGHVESIDERRAADSAAARIVGPDRIAGGVGIRRTPSKPGTGWVQEVRRSLEHEPNNIHRASTQD